MTGEQLRAARAMVRMEQSELARRADVSVETIKRLEKTAGPVSANIQTVNSIVAVLEKAGIEFTNGEQPGVKVRKEFQPGDYVRAAELSKGRPSVSVGKDHTGALETTIDISTGKKEKE